MKPSRRQLGRAEFLKRAGAVGLFAAAAATLPEASATRRPLRDRGVNYDAGTLFGPDQDLTRLVWSQEQMRDELHMIRHELHANALQVIGSDLDRLSSTAATALRLGMHVWVQPRLFDHTQEQILDHLGQTARAAERLRRQHRGVGLNVGVEASLFTPGIVPGESWPDRMENIGDPDLDWAAVTRRLNDFLRRAVEVARRHFAGRLTYAALTLEQVDWRRFDVVGVDYYTYRRTAAEHVAELRPYQRWGKPVLISEFGTCAFEGAPELEGGGWTIVDYTKPVPEIIGNPVRSEQVQAGHITGMLDVFESMNLHSAFVYTFLEESFPHSATNPRHDLDMASFSVVRVIRERHEDPLSPYRLEPKQSFHDLADRYR